jgi:hypothetical protein
MPAATSTVIGMSSELMKVIFGIRKTNPYGLELRCCLSHLTLNDEHHWKTFVDTVGHGPVSLAVNPGRPRLMVAIERGYYKYINLSTVAKRWDPALSRLAERCQLRGAAFYLNLKCWGHRHGCIVHVLPCQSSNRMGSRNDQKNNQFKLLGELCHGGAALIGKDHIRLGDAERSQNSKPDHPSPRYGRSTMLECKIGMAANIYV